MKFFPISLKSNDISIALIDILHNINNPSSLLNNLEILDLIVHIGKICWYLYVFVCFYYRYLCIKTKCKIPTYIYFPVIVITKFRSSFSILFCRLEGLLILWSISIRAMLISFEFREIGENFKNAPFRWGHTLVLVIDYQ